MLHVHEHLQLPTKLAAHRGFARTFQKGNITFGVISPFKGYPGFMPEILNDIGQNAKMVEKLGFSTLWVRDVPFFDPHFGDAAQALDPMITLGVLAAHTNHIAIGTAGLVAPLRSPIHIAKTAASMEVLTGGRFMLGLSSGDRPVEYPVFQQNFENRAERFQESFSMIRALLGQQFPMWQGQYYGKLDGSLDLIPKPATKMPMITVGRARQDLQWLANTSDAWIGYAANEQNAAQTVHTLAQLGDGQTWKPFSTAGFIELLDDIHAPAQLFNGVYLRGGSKGMAEFFETLRQNGVAHVAMNFKPTNRPANEALQDFAENVLNQFNFSANL